MKCLVTDTTINNMIYYIPKNINFIIVSDLFLEQYTGGAELSLEAILEKCDKKYFKINSKFLTEDLIKKNKDKYWILGNFSNIANNILAEFVRSNVNYSIIEFDYKFCIFRSKQLHEIKTGKQCDCHLQLHGKFIRAFFNKANKVFFMSEGQMNEYKTLFPQFNSDNFIVQGSTFSAESLDFIKLLQNERKNKQIINKTVILKGGTWIKNEQGSIQYCKDNNIEYVLIGELPYKEFLEKISNYSKFIFFPLGSDTCPRIVIEAKLLGLEVQINDYVQHKNDKWFKNKSSAELFDFLENNAENFWKHF